MWQLLNFLTDLYLFWFNSKIHTVSILGMHVTECTGWKNCRVMTPKSLYCSSSLQKFQSFNLIDFGYILRF